MKRFSFSLEKILELRDWKERQAEMLLAEKAAICSRLDLSLKDNAKASLEASRKRFRPGSISADHRAEELYALRLLKEKEKLLKAIALAEIEREQVRSIYIKASMEKKIVQKLKEKKEAEYKKNLKREEEKIMDEFASSANIRNSMTDRG